MRRTIVLVSALFLLVAGAGMASATTTHQHRKTETFVDVIPCLPGKATITITYNGVVHRNATGNRGYHENFTATGTFVAVYANGKRSSGHFTNHLTYNKTPHGTAEGSFTFNGHVTTGFGAGTHWHENQHFTTTQGAVTPKVAFDKTHCH